MPNLPQKIKHAILDIKETSSDPIALFIYDLADLQAHIRQLMNHLPNNVELYYAIKANSDKQILDTLAPWVNGFEISSGGEIHQISQCNQTIPFVFSGPGKLDSELEDAITNNVQAIHIESFNEIERLQTICARLNKTQEVFIRINPTLPDALESKLTMAGKATPFGIDEVDLKRSIDAVDASKHLSLKGFHIHAMSHQQSLDKHKALIDFYLCRWTNWKAMSNQPENITYLNVGGGIGVNYLSEDQFNWFDFCQYLDNALASMTDIPVLRFEPGRFITAFCGYYAIEVLDKKSSHGQAFLVCRGGTHQFRLPAAQGHDHPIIHIACEPSDADDMLLAPSWTVVGQLCTPKDILSRNVQLNGVNIGDVLVLPLAGAYGYNISHVNFLCHPQPQIRYLPVERGHKETA